MTIFDHPTYCLEALSIHEAFRRLGYPPDDIFFNVNGDDGNLTIQVILKHNGKDFAAHVASEVVESRISIVSKWKKAIETWNDVKERERCKKVWEDSVVCQNSVSFLVAMQASGFVHPAGRAALN